MKFSITIPRMFLGCTFRLCVLLGVSAAGVELFSFAMAAQHAPAASGARILLLPRQIVSGERATLAVLDVNGRLTPGVTVTFSNGDRFKTDATGRALFVAPLNPGVIFGSIEGRPGRVATVILSPADAASSSVEISSVPRVASLSDRVEFMGRGFCGEADVNQVTIGGQPAMVVASSPASLVAVPSMDLRPGPATVEISCAKRQAQPFSITLVALELEADASPLKPRDHRTLTVHVRGTAAKIVLEARNLAPDIAELTGGNPVRLSSSGGAENLGQFALSGRRKGSFLISIRLVPSLWRPQP